MKKGKTMFTGLKSKAEHWSDLRAKIKEKFSKLTDESIDSLKSDMDQLSSKLQTTYGYAKEKADSELAAFKSSLIPKTGIMKNISMYVKSKTETAEIVK